MNTSSSSRESYAAVVPRSRDGLLRAAAAEQRFSSIEHYTQFARDALEVRLQTSRTPGQDLLCAICFENSLHKFDRILLSVPRTYPESGMFCATRRFPG